MIELERHIEILLLSNDCVIVPGLGGFVAHHVDAYYDEEERMFFPPLRTVGFNPKLDMNDSLLVHSYIEAYDMSYPEAENRIRQEVHELRKNIEENGKYTLNDIGVLAVNGNGTYDFTPCEAGILTPELYGLYSFAIGETGRTENVPTIKMETAPVNKADITAAQADTRQAEAYTNESTISVKVSAIRNVMAFVIAVVAFFLISTPLGDNSRQGLEMGKIENGVIYRLMPKDVVLGDIKNTGGMNVAKDREANAEEKAAETAEKNANEGVKTAEEDYYCIVLAARITRKNAENYAGELTKKGLDGITVIKDRRGVKVVSGKYTSEKDAREGLNRMKENAGFDDCWIYQVRN